MLYSQVACGASKQDQPIYDILGNAVVSRQSQILIRQLFRDPSARVLTAAEQLML